MSTRLLQKQLWSSYKVHHRSSNNHKDTLVDDLQPVDAMDDSVDAVDDSVDAMDDSVDAVDCHVSCVPSDNYHIYTPDILDAMFIDMMSIATCQICIK